MAISQNTNVIVEFTWVCDENPELSYKVKTHIVDGLQTISLSEDGQNWYNLPASLFVEVVNALGQIRQMRTTPAPQQRRAYNQGQFPGLMGQALVQEQLAPAAQVAQHGLPLPNISRTMDSHGTLEPMAVAEINPLENFSNLGMLVAPSGRSMRKQRQAEATEEVINRPVIRGANEEISKMMRGGGNAEKAIKAKHIA